MPESIREAYIRRNPKSAALFPRFKQVFPSVTVNNFRIHGPDAIEQTSGNVFRIHGPDALESTGLLLNMGYGPDTSEWTG